MSSQGAQRDSKNAGPSARIAPGTARTRGTRERWVRRVLWWVVLPVTLYTLFGFFCVPLIIRHVIIPQINKHIVGTASLTKAAYNPFKLNLRLEGFTLADAAGAKVAAFEKFEGGFLLWDTLVKTGWHFDKAILTAPEARAEIAKDGAINFVTVLRPLLASATPDKPLRKIPRIVVHRMGVAGANVGLVDRTPTTPFETEWLDLTFDLDELDTRPDKENLHKLAAKSSGGEQAGWEGTFFADPFTSHGTFTIRNLDLPRFMPYAEGRTEGTLKSGKLSAEIEYDFAPVRSPRVVRAKVIKGGIEGLAIELGGKELLHAANASVEAMSIDADKREVGIARVSIDGAALVVERDAAGVISVTRLAPKIDPALLAGKQASGDSRVDPRTIEYPIQQVATAIGQLAADALGPWNLSLEKLTISSTTLAVRDAVGARPVAYTFNDIALDAGPVKSSERYKLPVKVSLTAAEGGTVAIDGVVEPFDRRLSAGVKTEGFNLAPASGYLPEKLPEPLPPAVLASALASVDGRFGVDFSNTANGHVTWDGRVHLVSTKLAPPAGDGSVASVGAVDLKGKADAEISELVLKALHWEGQAGVADAALGVSIAQVTRAAAAKLDADGKASVQFGSDGAKLAWEGKAGAGGVDLAATVAGPVALKLGSGSSAGSLQVDIAKGAAPAIVYSGALDASGAAIDAPEQFKAKLALTKGAVEGVRFSTQEKTATIKSLVADGPEVSVNFPILPPPGEAKAKKKAATAGGDAKTAPGFVNPLVGIVKQLGYSVKIEQVGVSAGKIAVADDSAQPPASVEVGEIEVAATNLSTDGQSLADVTISSKVAGSGSFKLAGKLDAFAEQPVADVQVQVVGVPAKPFDAFVGRYIGYLVDRGRVNSTIPIKIENGTLTGKLDFALDQFHLGESTKSPDAPDVPIKLGLDLLRDSNDKVAGKIPLSGKLSDPSFSITGLIWDAFFNLIFKAATAPFQILGSLFGAAEGQDLSMVACVPGGSELAPEALSTIDILAKAMKERPAITMVAGGRYNVEADTPGMRKVLLREQMLKRVQVGTPYIEKLDDKLYKTAVEAEWKEWRRAQTKDAQQPEAESGPVAFDQMEKDLLERVEVPVDRFVQLAKNRAAAVVAVLVKDNGISADRVKVGEDAPDKMASDKPKVEFGVK